MRVAVVSGGTGGICRYIVGALIEGGEVDRVIILTRDIGRISAVFPQGVEANRVLGIEIDPQKPEKGIADALADGDEVRWLINGAGTGIIADAKDTGAADAENMIFANCTLMTRITPAVLPYMKRGWHIVNIASAAAFCPQPHFSVYAASKAYALSYSRALGAELKGQKISVTAVCPGPVNTDFIANAQKQNKISPKKKRAMAEPRAVALHALKCAKKGKPLCIYSFKMKLAHIACKLLPTKLLMRFFN